MEVVELNKYLNIVKSLPDNHPFFIKIVEFLTNIGPDGRCSGFTTKVLKNGKGLREAYILGKN